MNLLACANHGKTKIKGVLLPLQYDHPNALDEPARKFETTE